MHLQSAISSLPCVEIEFPVHSAHSVFPTPLYFPAVHSAHTSLSLAFPEKPALHVQL